MQFDVHYFDDRSKRHQDGTEYTRQFFSINPYLKFENKRFAVEGEFWREFGDTKQYENDKTVTAAGQAWYISGKCKFGRDNASYLQLAHFMVSGDNNPDDDEYSRIARSTGKDFYDVRILNSWSWNVGGLNYTGNTSLETTAMAQSGVHALYAKANFKVNDKFTTAFQVAYEKADDAPKNWDDEYGFEYSANADFRFNKYITWNNTVSYLDAGDFFKKGVAAHELEDVFFCLSEFNIDF